MSYPNLPKIKACGVLCFRREPEPGFLLLRHPKRWDLPKGHIQRGESEQDCALRELTEETGILREQVELDPTFRFETRNPVRPSYMGGRLFDKTYVIFLAYVPGNVSITLSEHDSYQWFPWNPPYKIQKWLIDPLLGAVAEHLKSAKGSHFP